MSSFQKQYYRRLFRVFHIRHPYYRDQSWKYKADILQVEKLSRCMTAMIENDINSLDDAALRIKQLEEQTAAIQIRMQVLRTKLYQDTRFRLLSEYEKREDDQLQDPVISSRQNEISQLLERYGGIAAVRDMRNGIRTEISQLRGEANMLRKSIQSMKDVEVLYRQFQQSELQKMNTKEHSTDVSGALCTQARKITENGKKQNDLS